MAVGTVGALGVFHKCRALIYYNVFCNINHCNDSAPCWDLDWTIQSYLILYTTAWFNQSIKSDRVNLFSWAHMYTTPLSMK